MTDSALVATLLSECSVAELVDLLRCDRIELRRAAVVCLGRKGGPRQTRILAEVLRRARDADLSAAAEESLWQIWMRAGSSTANAALTEALEAIKAEDYPEALRQLDALCAQEPDFAESHHQRGIVLSLLDRPKPAAGAFRAALALNQYHFSAAANLGHALAQQADLPGALRCYRYALRLHPRLEGLPELAARIETALDADSVSS